MVGSDVWAEFPSSSLDSSSRGVPGITIVDLRGVASIDRQVLGQGAGHASTDRDWLVVSLVPRTRDAGTLALSGQP